MTNRELDELIARKAMGWKKAGLGITVDGYEFTPHLAYWVEGDICITTCRDFNPSTNISDAFKVIEKLKQIPYEQHKAWIHIEYQHGWQVCWMHDYDSYAYVSESETLPMAICLAAIKYLESSNE